MKLLGFIKDRNEVLLPLSSPLQILNKICHKKQLARTFERQWIQNSMYRSWVPAFYQDILLSIITSRENEYLLSRNQVISGCYHDDTRTRLVLHGSKVVSDVAVVFKDAYILMIWAYSELNITNKWYLKDDHEKFAKIRKIVLTWAKIVFEFTENTGLNRMQYRILFLPSREN